MLLYKNEIKVETNSVLKSHFNCSSGLIRNTTLLGHKVLISIFLRHTCDLTDKMLRSIIISCLLGICLARDKRFFFLGSSTDALGKFEQKFSA